MVVFHDVAYIEIKPIVKGRMLSVELVDFCVFYNQDNVRSLEQFLKNNSSKIIVDNGQIVKVSKDKIGIVKKIINQKWKIGLIIGQLIMILNQSKKFSE